MSKYIVQDSPPYSVYKKDKALGIQCVGSLEHTNGKYLTIHNNINTGRLVVLGRFSKREAGYKYIIEFDAMITEGIFSWAVTKLKHLATTYT